jgi:mannose-6-phosphate isomerase-like protein (cupin superfamily)
MPELIKSATTVPPAGEPPKRIDEYVGRVNTGTEQLSIAHMRSPKGWKEPGQKPEFDEYTFVLKGKMLLEFEGGSFDIAAGQAVVTRAGEWIRYSTPDVDTEYVAVCLPAFSPDTVHRDDD